MEDTDEFEEPKRSPIVIIGAIFLIFLLAATVVPYYSVKIDPSPTVIPTREEIYPFNEFVAGNSSSLRSLVIPVHPLIKHSAVQIVTKACSGDKICYAKALYLFVRDEIEYVTDPRKEYFEHPTEVMSSGGSDCDGMAILLSSLLEAVGIKTSFVYSPGHVYVKMLIPEAISRYKQEDGWIYADATCKTCEFGEVPFSVLPKNS